MFNGHVGHPFITGNIGTELAVLSTSYTPPFADNDTQMIFPLEQVDCVPYRSSEHRLDDLSSGKFEGLGRYFALTCLLFSKKSH